MDLKDYLRLLRVRRSLILFCAALGIGSAALATLAATPIYKSSAVIFVSTGDSGTVGGAYTGSLFSQARVKSYSQIIKSPAVLGKVVDELGLAESPDALAGAVTASAPLDTVLLNVSVTDPDPVRARDITNSVSIQFTRTVAELERGNNETAALVKASVVTPAQVSSVPVSPRPKLNLALGLLVGLAIGVGGAVAKETLDTSVKGTEDLRDRVGLPPMGVVPFDSQAPKQPLVLSVGAGSLRAEAFRQLRTNLQFIDVDRRPRSLVISSALPGEGKSTTACNLAITLAEAGTDVVLVEGDLRRPKVADYMGVEGAVGLTDVLIGKVSLDDALQPWGTTGHLWVLPCGPRPPNPSELLGSGQMGELISELEERGLVLFDAPPLLPVTDAAVLSARTSGGLLVVRANKTKREQVERAAEAMRSVGAHLYGAVLNMAPAKGPDAYQYGYGYEYGDSPEQTDGKVARSSKGDSKDGEAHASGRRRMRRSGDRLSGPVALGREQLEDGRAAGDDLRREATVLHDEGGWRSDDAERVTDVKVRVEQHRPAEAE